MAMRKTLIVLTALLPACSTMRPVESPVTFLEQNNPKRVRVYAADGELLVLREPQLRGDTVRGYEPLAQEEMSISLNGIRRMEALQPDRTRTTVFIGAMTILGGAGIYMIANASNGRKLICDDYNVANRCIERPTGSTRVNIPFSLKF
jgi:hypothetical protein